MTNGQPHTSPTARASAPANPGSWAVQGRTGTGLFVVSKPDSVILFRIDTANYMIYAWDKRNHSEIAIDIRVLFNIGERQHVKV